MFLPVAIVGPCGASIVSDQKWEMFGYKNTDFIPDAVKNRDGKVLWNEYDKSPQRVLLSFLITLQFLHCIWFGMILRVRFELKWYVELVRFELKWYVLSWNDTSWSVVFFQCLLHDTWSVHGVWKWTRKNSKVIYRMFATSGGATDVRSDDESEDESETTADSSPRKVGSKGSKKKDN